MSRRRKHARWACIGPVWLQLSACTLSSDYEPVRIDDQAAKEEPAPAALPAATLPQAPAPVAPAAAPRQRPDAGTGASCSDLTELPGCELPRAQPAPPERAECSSGLDCASQNCAAGRCVAASCSDRILNQGESAIDCGGPCPTGCTEGATCRSSADCAGGLSCGAATQRCAPPSCLDGLQNAGETGIDCGGSCAGCAAGSSCGRGSDCLSASCQNGACVDATCDDQVRNQDETDIDCGGVCSPCAPGRACALDGDCASGACQDGRCCGGQEADCTRCARRLSTTLECTSNGVNAETVAVCTSFLQCLADNAARCPRRSSPGCTDAGGGCDVARFGGDGSAGVALADGILGTAQCNF